jgi:hypothetical protein
MYPVKEDCMRDSEEREKEEENVEIKFNFI